MKRFLKSAIGKVLLTSLLVILPVIPVWSALVVPHPIFALTWVSLLQLILIYWMVGIHYAAAWYSWLAFLVVVALIVLVWLGVNLKVKTT